MKINFGKISEEDFITFYPYEFAHRFLIAEEDILKNAYDNPELHTKNVFYYARDIIDGRWPAGEAVIAKDSEFAYRYAMAILNGRFPLGEAVIASDGYSAFHYAKNVIKGRWPLAEKMLHEHPFYARHYKKLFKL